MIVYAYLFIQFLIFIMAEQFIAHAMLYLILLVKADYGVLDGCSTRFILVTAVLKLVLVIAWFVFMRSLTSCEYVVKNVMIAVPRAGEPTGNALIASIAVCAAANGKLNISELIIILFCIQGTFSDSM